MTARRLASVVIPAYNAEATLDETLRSVRSQTHREIEIIVVDDGSTDNTCTIAMRHAAADDRIQVATQENAGLAAARNAGWRRARSDLIAFLDADDLWAPTVIERHIESLQSSGDGVGLVYCGSVRIDSHGVVTWDDEVPCCSGDVLERLLVGNFVGNGSAAMVRRQALIDAGGFEGGLRAAGAEGCEDFLLLCRVAEKYHFAVVPENLVGYRSLPHSMSSNRPRMLRSWMLVSDEMLARHPGYIDLLRQGLRNYGGWLVWSALASGRFGQLSLLLLMLFRRRPMIAVRVLLNEVFKNFIIRLPAKLRKIYRGKAKRLTLEISMRFPVGDVDLTRPPSEARVGRSSF